MTKPIAAYSWTEDRVQVRHLAGNGREVRDQQFARPLRLHLTSVSTASPQPLPGMLPLPGLAESEIHGIKELRSPLSD